MAASGMLHCVALVRSEVSDERLTRDTWRNIPEDAIVHNDRRETLKSCLFYIVIYLDGTPLLQSLKYYDEFSLLNS
jgi:hypothetical protein